MDTVLLKGSADPPSPPPLQFFFLCLTNEHLTRTFWPWIRNHNASEASHRPKQHEYRSTKQWLEELDKIENLIKKCQTVPDENQRAKNREPIQKPNQRSYRKTKLRFREQWWCRRASKVRQMGWFFSYVLEVCKKKKIPSFFDIFSTSFFIFSSEKYDAKNNSNHVGGTGGSLDWQVGKTPHNEISFYPCDI